MTFDSRDRCTLSQTLSKLIMRTGNGKSFIVSWDKEEELGKRDTWSLPSFKWNGCPIEKWRIPPGVTFASVDWLETLIRISSHFGICLSMHVETDRRITTLSSIVYYKRPEQRTLSNFHSFTLGLRLHHRLVNNTWKGFYVGRTDRLPLP